MEQEWQQIYIDHVEWITQTATKIVRRYPRLDEDDFVSLVRSACLSSSLAFIALRLIKPNVTAKQYYYGIIKYKLCDSLRREDPISLESLPIEFSDNNLKDEIGYLIDRILLREIIKDSLKHCSPVMRKAWTLYVFDGCTHSDIKAILGISEGYSRLCIHRVNEKIREQANFHGLDFQFG